MFFCIEMSTKKVIFESAAKGDHGQKYLSLHKKNEIKMFRVNQEKQSFEEDVAVRFCADDEDEMLEKRQIGDVNTLLLSIKHDVSRKRLFS